MKNPERFKNEKPIINHDPEYLSDMIDSVSRYLLENEAMMIRARRLRQKRTEVFGETR
jgi:hypothetical protein